jgi:hypothetical protein
MNINKMASMLDIGFILAEASGDLTSHAIRVDSEKGTIDIYYVPIMPIKKIKVTLSTGKVVKSKWQH